MARSTVWIVPTAVWLERRRWSKKITYVLQVSCRQVITLRCWYWLELFTIDSSKETHQPSKSRLMRMHEELRYHCSRWIHIDANRGRAPWRSTRHPPFMAYRTTRWCIMVASTLSALGTTMATMTKMIMMWQRGRRRRWMRQVIPVILVPKEWVWYNVHRN